MNDSVMTVVAIGLAAVLMFMFPLMSTADRSDDIAQQVVQTATTEFVDNIRSTGKITQDKYDSFTDTLAATGNPAAILGIMGMINDSMQLRQKREYTPIQAKGNTNSGDVTYAMGMNQFMLYKMSCRYEFAKRCDDYLSMFGYKTNDVKIPNTTGRTNWNYVKTIGCNFEGDIPQIYLNKIKEIFDKGITLWHNANTMYDYSQSNNIVS